MSIKQSAFTGECSSGFAHVPDVQSLYKQHNHWLIGWLLKKLGCPHNAADLAQDTFVRVLTGEDPASLREPRAYLLVIANRLMINRHRRRKVEEEALRQVATILEKYETRDPENINIARNLLAKILLLLTEELPEKQRDAFIMARVDGLSYRVIAEKLQVSESSVKQYLSKTLVHCHARLFDSLNQVN